MDNFSTQVTSPDLNTRAEYSSAVSKANELLESMVAASRDSSHIHAIWHLVPNPVSGRVLGLELGDPVGGRVVEHFKPAELAGDDGWFALSEVYRRLLGQRLDRRLEDVRSAQVTPVGTV